MFFKVYFYSERERERERDEDDDDSDVNCLINSLPLYDRKGSCSPGIVTQVSSRCSIMTQLV